MEDDTSSGHEAKPLSALRLNPKTSKASEAQTAGGQVMPSAAFLDNEKPDEKEEKQAKREAKFANLVKTERGPPLKELKVLKWLSAVFHDQNKFVAFIKRYYRVIIIATATVALAYYWVILPIYYAYLLDSGEQALVESEYDESIDYTSRYLAPHSDDAEAIFLLVQANMFGRRFDEAKRVLDIAEDNPDIVQTAKFWYYRAALRLLSEPKKTNPYIDKALSLEPEHAPTLLLRGLDSIAKRNWQNAQSSLGSLLLIVESGGYREANDRKDFDFWMSYYFKNKLLPVIGTIPDLPFSKLAQKAPISDRLGFDIDTSGFQNLYYVPYDIDFLKSMDIPNIVSFLLAVAYTIDEKQVQTKAVLTAVGDNSVWVKYFRAYLDVLEKNYTAAVKRYDEIVTESPSSDSLVMLANVHWANSQGVKPTEALMTWYDSAYNADKKNILAVNNLAFMNIYVGEEDKARSLLQTVESEAINSYVGVNLALLELSSGAFDEARSKVYALLENNPDSLSALNAALLIERELGNYQLAINIANVIKKIPLHSERAYLDIANIYKQHGNYLLQLAELKKGYEKYPLNAEIVIELALSYIQNRQYKNAKKVLQYAIISIGDDYRVLLARGLLNAPTNTETAEAFFRRAVAQAPPTKRPEVLFLLGRFYLKAGKTQKTLETVELASGGYNDRQNFNLLALKLRANAVADINKVSEEKLKQALSIIKTGKNTSMPAQIDIAWVLLLLGQTEQAIEILENLLSRQGQSLEVLSVLEVAYLKIGATEEAETAKKRVVAIKANDQKSDTGLKKRQETTNKNVFADAKKHALFKEINEQVSQSNYEKAIALYTELLKQKRITKSPASTYQNRGALYIKIKKYDLAAADFVKAIDIGGLTDEELQGVRYNFAYVLIQMQKYTDAVAHLEAALAQKPTDEIKYLKLLGIAYAKANNINDSLRVYETLIKKAPNYEVAYFNVANIYHRFHGDVPKSIETLLLLSSLQPDNAEVYHRLGEYYTLIGETDKATNNFNLYEQLK